jgi:hypothetical protein
VVGAPPKQQRTNDHGAHRNQRHHLEWVIPPRRVECGPEGRSAWVVARLEEKQLEADTADLAKDVEAAG